MNGTASDGGGRRPRAAGAVLVISASTEATLPWNEAKHGRFRTHVVGSVEEALPLPPVDVVVLERDVDPSDEALERLCAELDHASLLVTADHYDERIAHLMRKLGGALCLLSADAPAAIQAQVVTMAADRARLDRELRGRIAELERHTHDLEESRARFRDVIERNADAIIVVDRDGVIRFANPMAVRLFRSERDALVGSHFGYPVTHGETSELDVIGPGAHRLVEMRVVESEWEGVDAYIASLRDITERRRAEENALRLTREQAARSAAETAATRFRFLADAGTRLSLRLDYNETVDTLTRLCVPELADWAAFYAPDDHGRMRVVAVEHRDPMSRELARAYRERWGPHHEHRLVQEVLCTGDPVLVDQVDEATLRALAGGAGCTSLLRELGAASLMLVPLIAREHRLGVLALVSGASARRFTPDDLAVAHELAARAALAMANARLYREANEANQAKTRLLAVISHDLRTPLNAIIGYSDLLSMGISDTLSETGTQQVDRIRMSAKHLVYLIDELLSFARLDGGGEEPHMRTVDACELVREVGVVVEPLAGERGLSLHVDVPAEPTLLETDPDRLRQVLLNLAGNAVRYTEEGSVRLELADDASQVAFRVRDTGIGISRDHLERIFEPFWQADPRQRTAGGGTGLGLSVVRRIVGMLQGVVSVESEPERGTAFTVRLPRRSAAERARHEDSELNSASLS